MKLAEVLTVIVAACVMHAIGQPTVSPVPEMTFMCGYCGTAGPGLGIQIRCFDKSRVFELRQGCNDDCSNCTTTEQHAYGAKVDNEHGSFTAGNNTVACEGVAYLRYHNKTCNDWPLTGPKYRDSLQSGYCRADVRLTCSGDAVVVSNCTTGAVLPLNESSCFLVDNQHSKVQCLGSGRCFQIFSSS